MSDANTEETGLALIIIYLFICVSRLMWLMCDVRMSDAASDALMRTCSLPRIPPSIHISIDTAGHNHTLLASMHIIL